MWVQLSFVLSQITRLRETDGQTEFSSLDRVCIPCSAVKSVKTYTLHSTNVVQTKHKTLLQNVTNCYSSLNYTVPQ